MNLFILFRFLILETFGVFFNNYSDGCMYLKAYIYISDCPSNEVLVHFWNSLVEMKS